MIDVQARKHYSLCSRTRNARSAALLNLYTGLQQTKTGCATEHKLVIGLPQNPPKNVSVLCRGSCSLHVRENITRTLARDTVHVPCHTETICIDFDSYFISSIDGCAVCRLNVLLQR